MRMEENAVKLKKNCWDHLRKAAFLMLLILIVSFVSACSCQNTADSTEESVNTETEPGSLEEPTEPESTAEELKSIRDVVLFWNVDRDLYAHQSDTYLSNRPKDPDDGTYHFLFATTENRQVTRRTAEPSIKNQIDEYRLVLLEFDEKNLITGVKNVEELVGELAVNLFYVESVEEGVMTCYSSPNYEGEKAIVDLKGLKIFDCSDRALVTGELASEEAVEPGSRVIVVPDLDGSPTYLFLYSRPKEEMKLQEHHTCPECGKDVEWWGWNDEKHLPTTEGHYFLLNDVKVTAQAAIEENQHVVLCLNGFQVTGTGKRTVALFYPGCAFTLCDCKETGCISNAYTKGHNETTQGAVVWGRYGTFRMYGGTLDASKVLTENTGAAVCMNANTTFEFHGGEIIGGAATQGSAVRINDKANFVMTGGKMSGGIATKREEDDVLDIIGKNGTVSITGGTIDGGCYVTARPEITIGGEVTITGKKNGLCLEDDTKVRLQGLSGKSKIGILLGNGAGVFTSNYQAGAEGLFVSDDSTLKVASAGGAALQLVEITPHVHCTCGTGTVTDDGHAHANAVWQPWSKTNTLPKESGYYYLKNNVKLTSGFSPKEGATVYLCLNGHNIEQSAVSPNPKTGNIVNPRIVTFGATYKTATKYVLSNCGKKDKSHGKLYRSNTNSYNGQGAMLWTGANNEKLNVIELYNVYLDASNYNTSNSGGCICVQAYGVLKAFNVTLIGGSATKGSGGAVAVTGGRAEFYHSEISGGTASKSGGAVYVSNGELLLSNTTVKGGNAPSAKNLLLSGGTLLLECDTKIDEVYVSAGKKITLQNLGQNAKIGIAMDDDSDPFAVSESDLSARFTSTKSGLTVQYVSDEKALYLVDPNAAVSDHQHCVCGTGLITAGGHAHETAAFTAWNKSDSLPAGTEGKTKYYYLTKDVELTVQINPVENSTVYLCLNGHQITATNNGRTFALNAANVKYVLTNCGARDQSHGIVKNTHTERTYDNNGGIIWLRYATDTVELYNVTLDGGTHKIAKIGGLVHSEGTLKAWNTVFSGGLTTGVQTNGTNVESDGGALNLKGTVALYDSEIRGSSSAGNGGAIAFRGGTMTLSNVKISGTNAGGLGNGIYVTDGTVVLSGTDGINELYLASGKTATLKDFAEDSSVGIRMADGKGTFAIDAFRDYSAAFTPVDASYVVRYAGKDHEMILASPSDPLPDSGDDVTTEHKHCKCGTGLTISGHTCEEAVWEPWESSTSLPTGAGEENGKHYYLVSDVTVSAQLTAGTAGTSVYLCLNGHQVTATNNGRTIAFNAENVTYVITNCKEKTANQGVIVNTHTARNYDNEGGIFWQRYASDTLELYNVTVNGGTHKIAKTGGVLHAAGRVTAVNVLFTGGETTGVQNNGTAVSTSGGALYLKGNAELIDSEVQGGKTAGNGGSVMLDGGTLKLENTKVSGGTASGSGNGVYVSNGVLTVSGATTVDELILNTGKKIAIESLSDAASVKIGLISGTGVFAENVSADVSARFTPVSAELEVTYDGTAGTLSLTEKPAPVVQHLHCECANAMAHAHAEVEWIPWNAEASADFATTLPAGSAGADSYYYLTADVSLSENYSPAEGANVRICLNGHTVVQTNRPRRVSNVNASSGSPRKLTFTDCKGTGTLTIGQLTLNDNGGMFMVGGMAENALTLYHVTVDGSKRTVNPNSGAKGNGGILYMTKGTFKAYGVTFTGGTAKGSDGASALYITGGSAELYQCTVTGGNATAGRAGSIFVSGGTLLLSDTSVGGATGTGVLGAVFSTGNGVTVAGTSVIESLYLASGKTVTFSNLQTGASVGVTLQDGTGTVAANASASDPGFVYAGEGLSVIYKEDEQLLMIVTAS